MLLFLRSLRYYLELLALPFFVFLVVHLSGHGLMILLEGHHEHGHEEESSHFFEMIFSPEVLVGILLLLFFVWIWHRPVFKKWVPCAHDHCHTEQSIAHFSAIVAFCIHFFPEAEIRYVLLEQFSWGNFVSLAGFFAFTAHFLVDIIVAIILSSYFSSRKYQIISFILISSVWLLAFFLQKNILEIFPEMFEGILFLFSAFIMAMFIHRPHQQKHCGTCQH